MTGTGQVAVARLSEGFCPRREHDTLLNGRCDECDGTWELEFHDGVGMMLLFKHRGLWTIIQPLMADDARIDVLAEQVQHLTQRGRR